MLIQNQYDGRFYEVPEVTGYGEYAAPGYHGLGLPFLPIAAKIGARFLPRALPYARRFLRRFRRRFPGIRRFPFMPGVPLPAGVPPFPIPSPLLSTNVARKVVAMLRQQGLQVTPAQPPGPPPGPEPAAPPPGAEPQPGVGEYPYDPQAAASEESDPYAEQETYPYQYPYQYPYASMSPWRRFSRWGRRFPGWWGRRSYSWARPGAWPGRWTGLRANVVRRHYATARRAAPAYTRPVSRGRR